jgi:proline dehydrogenase
MQLLRSSLLWASQNKRIERIVRGSTSMRPLVSRFMPGETIDDVLRAIEALHNERTPSIVTYLGENVATAEDADQTVAEYERLLAALNSNRADAHVSIKLTQFGWDLDRADALDRVRTVAKTAATTGTVLAIDMESSLYVESTIEAYESLSREFRDTALCLQAYLHRTPDDVRRLIPSSPYIRLVKGAYREPADRALQDRHEVTARYRSLARDLLSHVSSGTRVAFGTHDLDLLRQIRSDARELGVPQSAYEIQMLYGIQNEARRALAAEGEHVRVLISYGKAWYAWFMRRLAEKPSNLMLIARQ